MRTFIRQHSLASFIVLAYALSWADWIPILLRGDMVVPGGSVTHFPGLMGPAVAAFVILFLTEGPAGVAGMLRRMVQVSSPPLRFLAYSLSPVAFLLLALAIGWIMGQPAPAMGDFGIYSGLRPLSMPVVFLLVFLFNGYGEETGWRGFALGPLQEKFGSVRGTLVGALIWAGWHTPAFWFVEGYTSLSVPVLIGGFGLGICAGAVVLARVLNRTNGSVLAAALWHATYNLTSATAASRGLVGAVTTMCTMVWATVLLVQEWRRPVGRLSVSRES